MAGCEKCWRDAYNKSIFTGKTQAECYQILLKERENNPCTPKEQAGDYWDNKKQCDVRFIENK